MADGTYTRGIYRKQGGDELVVASGGTITVESGGIVAAQAGGYVSQAVQAAATTATVITPYGLTLVDGTTAGPTFLISNPIIGVQKYLSLNASSSGVTHRAIIAPATTGVSFDTTGGNRLTLATSAVRGISLVGMTTASYRIVGVYTGVSIADVFSS